MNLHHMIDAAIALGFRAGWAANDRSQTESGPSSDVDTEVTLYLRRLNGQCLVCGADVWPSSIEYVDECPNGHPVRKESA